MTDTRAPPIPQQRAHKPDPVPTDADVRRELGGAWWGYGRALVAHATRFQQRQHLTAIRKHADELIRRIDAADANRPGVI